MSASSEEAGFIPSTEKRELRYENVRKLFDPEEIKRRKERSHDQRGVSLSQIMDRLQKELELQ
jgi:hypothetical protein